jgi:predicted unusual protein kinase regulating ubiquinone biosynthesis (AarF/ABC1/UbiB family)
MNRQIFEDNFFHSDLHPGNILLLRNNEVALIDFGAAGSLDADFLQKYSMYYQAIVGREFARAVDLLLLLAPQAASSKTEEFRRRYVAVMKAFEVKAATNTLSYHDRSIVSVFGEIMKDLAALEIPLDWSFMRADRAQLTLDASLMYLLPGVDYLELVGDYWRSARARAAIGSVRAMVKPRGLRGVVSSIRSLLEHAEDAQGVGTGIFGAPPRTARRAPRHMTRMMPVGLRLVSDALIVAIAAGTLTYLNTAVAGFAGRLDHLQEIVSAWRSFPPPVAGLVLIALAIILWKTARLKAQWLRPRLR